MANPQSISRRNRRRGNLHVAAVYTVIAASALVALPPADAATVSTLHLDQLIWGTTSGAMTAAGYRAWCPDAKAC
jgi:hypothetical protein